MEMHWYAGGGFKAGPSTTQLLAQEVRNEGRLGAGSFYNGGLRCVLGVIRGSGMKGPTRTLYADSAAALWGNGITTRANDKFQGTPEERCSYMADLIAAIP